MSTETTPAQEPVRSPFAGCLILFIAASIVIGLAFFAWWTAEKQAEEISKFTETSPKKVSLLDPAEHQTQFNELAAKLQHFKHEFDQQRTTRLDLTRDELNLAIAAYPAFEALRSQFYISEITPDSLTAEISFQLGSSPFSKRVNYLNATLLTKPVLNNGQIYLEVKKITPSVGHVPDPFREHLSPYLITEVYMDHPVFGPIMKALTGMELQSDQISLLYDPSGTPPTSDGEADASARQATSLMALFALIFLLTMVLFFVLMSRRKKEKRGTSI